MRVAAACASFALLVGCGRDDEIGDWEGVATAVSATLAFSDGGDRLTGTVSIDLSLPEGEEEREIVLGSIAIGGRSLGKEEIQGLDAFPDSLGGGERAHVDLSVDIGDLSTLASLSSFGPASCATAVEVPVDVSVLDAEVAEEGGPGSFTTAFASLRAPAPPAPLVSIERTWDLATFFGGGVAVAADPASDEDLLVASGTDVARIGSDGAERWRTVFTGIESIVGVARGGGVDAVAAFGDPDGLPCDPSTGDDLPAVFVARVEGGSMIWCSVVADTYIGMVVTDAGTIVARSNPSPDWRETRLSLFPADGEPEEIVIPVPGEHLVLAGDAIVVGGNDAQLWKGRIAVVRDGRTTLIDLTDTIARMVERRDGTVGLVTFDANGISAGWRSLDPRTGEGAFLTAAPPEIVSDAFVELPDGRLLTVTGGSGLDGGSPLVARLGDAWTDALTCTGQAARMVNGSRGEALLALDAQTLVLGGVEQVAAGSMRTIVARFDGVAP